MKLQITSYTNKPLQLRTHGKSYNAVWDLDTSFIGTKDYMGFAYFWDSEVKHTMRELSSYMRKVIHDTALEEGLFEDSYRGKSCSYVPTTTKLIQIINATLIRYKPKDYKSFMIAEDSNWYKVRKDIG